MISAQRTALHDWVCDRFSLLLSTDSADSALAFADEWFEWLDPDSVNTETTLYFNEDELKGLYEQVRE
jgi:hypothetical protein